MRYSKGFDMNYRRVFVVGVVAALAVAIGCLADSTASRSATPPPASAPATSRDLAQYYGFGPMEILKLDFGIGRPVLSDINHDGRNAIVFTNNGKSRIDILVQKRPGATSAAADEDVAPAKLADDQDINDRFGRESAWRFKRFSLPLDVEAESLVVADLNGDGYPGLAFCSKGRGVYVVFQDPPKKGEKPTPPREPKWQSPVKIDLPDVLTFDGCLAVGDLHGNGRADIAVLCGDGVSVIEQKADHTFARPVKYYTGGERLRQISVVDMDGDGRADLVTLTTDREKCLCVRFQSAAGQLGPEVRFDLPMPATLLPCAMPGSKQAGLLTVAAQSGRVRLSALAPKPGKASFPVYSYPLPMGEGADGRDAVTADLTGSGLLDIVVTDPAQAEFLLFKSDAKSLPGEPKRFPGLVEMTKLAALRIGGDKADSILALSVKEKIIGISRFEDGRLSFPKAIPIQGEPLAMAVCDLDSSGKPSLVYMARDKKEEKFTLRTVRAVGTKEATSGPDLELTELKDKPLDIVCGDISRSGRCDILVLRPYDPVLLVRQDAGGKLAQVTRRDVQSGLMNNVFPGMISLAPLGPKQSTAVLLAQKAFARALQFDADKGWQVLDQYESADPHGTLSVAAACRLTPDAASPAIVAYDSARGRIGILTEQADKTYRPADEIEVGPLTARKIVAGPFGGPSPVSILLAGTQKLVIAPVGGRVDELRELASMEPLEDARYSELAVGDMNHDGRPKIVAVDAAHRCVDILAFNGDAKLVSAFKFKVFEQPEQMDRPRGGGDEAGGEPRCVLVGDVTGHGKADLVVLTHDRLIIYPQE